MTVIVLPCDSPLAQWQPDDLGAPGGPLRWHNSAYPGLCLTGLGNEQQVLALACGGSPSQQWWDNSRGVSDRAWESGDGQARLRAWNRHLGGISSRDHRVVLVRSLIQIIE
ncbi:hypothetical protein [Streptomyces sp. NPDC058755]|uniref:hypothetical protein n=1 Tax=Streptomyces sp. NPDC058755 TaxID=3346624 RepID=UPI0036A6EFD2